MIRDILHNEIDKIRVTIHVDGKDIRYPDICYRCEPDRFLKELERMEVEPFDLHEV